MALLRMPFLALLLACLTTTFRVDAAGGICTVPCWQRSSPNEPGTFCDISKGDRCSTCRALNDHGEAVCSEVIDGVCPSQMTTCPMAQLSMASLIAELASAKGNLQPVKSSTNIITDAPGIPSSTSTSSSVLISGLGEIDVLQGDGSQADDKQETLAVQASPAPASTVTEPDLGQVLAGADMMSNPASSAQTQQLGTATRSSSDREAVGSASNWVKLLVGCCIAAGTGFFVFAAGLAVVKLKVHLDRKTAERVLATSAPSPGLFLPVPSPTVPLYDLENSKRYATECIPFTKPTKKDLLVTYQCL